MLTRNIVADDLAPFSYYKNVIPLYLQNQNGLLGQMQMLYDVFFANHTLEEERSSVATAINTIFNSFNIFSVQDDGTFSTVTGNDEYLAFLDALPDAEDNAKSLDLLAHFFGIGRNIKVTYLDTSQTPAIEVTEELTLNDEELLIYIKAMVIRNTFDGTYEKLIECYNMINLPIIALTEDNSEVYAEANVYLMLSSPSAVSSNIKKLFLAGKLFIESMGIKYNYSIQDAQHVAIFDDSTLSRTFDNGQFVL